MDDEYGRNEKKIIFYDTDKRHADLKIRLQHDGFTQSAFFRALISGYLEGDDNIMVYIDEYKERNQLQSRADRSKAKKMADSGKEIEKAHGLGEEEVENIFDLIEQEHPEL